MSIVVKQQDMLHYLKTQFSPRINIRLILKTTHKGNGVTFMPDHSYVINSTLSERATHFNVFSNYFSTLELLRGFSKYIFLGVSVSLSS